MMFTAFAVFLLTAGFTITIPIETAPISIQAHHSGTALLTRAFGGIAGSKHNLSQYHHSLSIAHLASNANNNHKGSFATKAVKNNTGPFKTITQQQYTYSMPEFLDDLFAHYGIDGKLVPAETIAQLVAKMIGALKAHFDGQPIKMEMPLRLENFLINYFNDAEFDIKFRELQSSAIGLIKKPLFFVHLNDLTMMSPEQIEDMREAPGESDIVWFFGSLIHLMLFRNYPLDAWSPKQLLDAKFNLAPLTKRQFSLTNTFNFALPEKMEEKYVLELAELIRKQLGTGKQIPIQAYDEFFNNNSYQYKILLHTMKHSLQTFTANRILLEQLSMIMAYIAKGDEKNAN